ncbi:MULTISPECIES: twin-arginine translocase TatA/TatE family subunit [unclassified Arcicella]|uniref:Sec-independent protein translocase subunit TatA/TatB n=1 Tax=unclassified Arcicella TaxID=2644986 RepID=UPI0028656D13|nr:MULTISPECIES: twin-arginine translocase TatA/TatE family subunit [unclassified Arcicella]MDR6563002.1 sec-independent protein translocase protein TatA [Arcicella sp. BE51]MDR6813086.1 sec-independent protein translocase protein TatA [Arcicella sp. BE140]MDR6824400.1 sec-independent protein translocase protein TatA [Arcicella sp. BE139]
MELTSIYLIFNMGGPELILVGLAVLLFFGGKKLPELMKGLGKGIKEFKEAQKDVTDQITKGLEDDTNTK